MSGKQVNVPLATDRSECIFCQESTTEVLQCPGNLRRAGIAIGTGYNTLASNILRFNEIGCLPTPLDVARLDDGNGIATTFIERNAKWHKTCSNKFNNLKLQRAEKRNPDKTDCPLPTKFTRKSSNSSANVKSCCFFCDDDSGTLHQASTFNMDIRVRECALKLQDKVLLAKLSAGDLMSQEAVYHSKCLVALYNKAQRASDSDESGSEKVIQGIALAQLVAYIEETRAESADSILVFRLAELSQMYSTRLGQLGGDDFTRVHSTHLKERILENVQGLQAHKQGRDVMLAFNDDIGQALKNLY